MKRKRKAKGVYCIEGDWWGNPHRQSSVQPMLELLSKWEAFPIPFVHRTVATRAEFDHYLLQCTQAKFARYRVIYFGFHGAKGSLYVGDQRRKGGTVDVQDIATLLKDRANGKVLYFASCETLNINGNELNGILQKTGAKAVCGYCADVDWLESTAFDTILLGQFQHGAFTRASLRAVNREVRKKARSLVDRLGFRMVVG